MIVYSNIMHMGYDRIIRSLSNCIAPGWCWWILMAVTSSSGLGIPVTGSMWTAHWGSWLELEMESMVTILYNDRSMIAMWDIFYIIYITVNSLSTLCLDLYDRYCFILNFYIRVKLTAVIYFLQYCLILFV